VTAAHMADQALDIPAHGIKLSGILTLPSGHGTARRDIIILCIRLFAIYCLSLFRLQLHCIHSM
jgi:hypothetical protein